jgi:hypothetical protein
MLWCGLLLGSQATDTLTTATDRARGAVEAMPVTARLLEVGGVAMLWGFKVLVVATMAVTLLTAASLIRDGHRFSYVTFRLCLVAVQLATVGLAAASLSNLALLSSIV